MPYAFEKTFTVQSFDEAANNSKSSILLARHSQSSTIYSLAPQPENEKESAESQAAKEASDSSIPAGDIPFNMNDPYDSNTGLREFFSRLLPALIGCWIESEPNSTLTSTSATHNMVVILEVISMLIERIIEKSKDRSEAIRYLREKYIKEIEKRILPHFPYAEAAGASETVILSPTRHFYISNRIYYPYVAGI